VAARRQASVQRIAAVTPRRGSRTDRGYGHEHRGLEFVDDLAGARAGHTQIGGPVSVVHTKTTSSVTGTANSSRTSTTTPSTSSRISL